MVFNRFCAEVEEEEEVEGEEEVEEVVEVVVVVVVEVVVVGGAVLLSPTAVEVEVGVPLRSDICFFNLEIFCMILRFCRWLRASAPVMVNLWLCAWRRAWSANICELGWNTWKMPTVVL